ncbi:hypothetical protein CY35_01G029900 [Sphagnum magellanicum]|nr:hypothetical protein CY35_01G029900 [Sphagnum magellanicum]
MADKYLQLSRDVVDGVRVQIENEELVVTLNGFQCKVLMKELVQTVKEIIANVASVPHKGRVYQQSCRAVLQELYRVVKDAEAIIHACCDENWVQAAIILVNIDEVFVDVLFRLYLCTSALGIVIQSAKSGPSSELQHVSKNIQAVGQVVKMQEIRQMLSGNALEDRRTLRRRLQGLQKGTGTPDEQEIVAKLLKFTDPAANMLQDEMGLASSLWSGTMGAMMDPLIGAAAMGVAAACTATTGVAAAMGVASDLAEGTSSAPRSQRFIRRNLVIMSRMDFPAISSTVLPGRNWLHSVKSQDLKEQKIISKGVVAEVSEVKWLGRTFARKSFKSISSYKFMLAAEKFARLSHPHVLQVFGHSVELGWSPSGSLVMELMYGDLKKLGLASRQLLVAVDTLLQIAEGMKYLHEQDIVHGDLNARNILINRVPIPEMEEAGYVQAKVAGFGVSGEPRTGTAGWMAPELFEKQNSQPNQEQFMASDIYSYAVTCFEILTSKSPFAEAENQAEVRAAVKAGARPHLPDSLPTSLQSLIRRCWDADASNRPSFSEICAELRKCKCDLMLNGDATLMEGAQGQLGVRMSRKVGAHEKPIGESPIIILCWRVAYEDNALEFFFHSAKSMSSFVGVGLKFGMVVVSASNLEVKIIDIGKETWEAELSTFTALDNMLEVVSIDHAEMIGARSQKNSVNELLTGKESAEQYGVGLLSGNTVQSTDVPHDSGYCLVLHKIVEYLMLKKVDLAKIGKQCVGSGGAGSSGSGGRNPNQGNDGGSLSWILANLRSWFGKAQSNSNNDGGDADPSKNQREKLAVDRANTKECKITVDASPKASFFDGEFQLPVAPTKALNEAAIKPTLEFNFVINSNGSKRICVETSVAFELGSAAPRSPALNGQFGWYQDRITFYLEGSERASLLPSSCVLKADGSGEAPKATLKLIDTDAYNFAREQDASLTVGANILVTTATGSTTLKETNTTGQTSAQERNFESYTPEDQRL